MSLTAVTQAFVQVVSNDPADSRRRKRQKVAHRDPKGTEIEEEDQDVNDAQAALASQFGGGRPNICVKETFYIASPLYRAKEAFNRGKSCTDDMSPFWALDRTDNSRDVNMKLEGLLSKFKAAVPSTSKHRAPNAERFSYLSHLSQLFLEL